MARFLSDGETEEKVCIQSCVRITTPVYGKVSLNCFFLSEEFKQYLTFSVETCANTLIRRIRSIYGVMKRTHS